MKKTFKIASTLARGGKVSFDFADADTVRRALDLVPLVRSLKRRVVRDRESRYHAYLLDKAGRQVVASVPAPQLGVHADLRAVIAALQRNHWAVKANGEMVLI